MASDDAEHHRPRHHKHRRGSASEEEEVEKEKSSKRHKHRHHKHHHHRSHRSKRRDDEEEVMVNQEAVKGEDDVEEGEIREEEMEDGEKKAGESDEAGDRNLGYSAEGDKLTRNGHKESQDDLVPRESPVSETNCVSKGYGEKAKLDLENDQDNLEKEKESLSNNSIENKSKSNAYSPSHDKYYDESYHRSRSRSYDRARGRSRSRSVLDEEHRVERRRHHGRDYYYDDDRGRTVCDLDEEIVAQRGKDRHHRSRERHDYERERSASRSRYVEGNDRRQRRESRERYPSGERDAYYDHRKERELERSRDMDIDRDRRADEWERRMGRELDREQRRDRVRESRDRDMDKDRRREKVRERSRDRARISERDKDVERDRYWDSERGRDLRHVKEREAYRSRDIEVDRDKYDDKYANSRFSRHEERTRKSDRAKANSPRSDLVEGKSERHDKEDEGFEERVSLQLAEQEDEDLNRIEESRRRRQAILEKYKNQQSQQQIESHPQVVEQGNNSAEQPNPSVATNNTNPETPDGRNDGADVSLAEHSFSVGKSPQQNGTAAPEKPAGASGLGEGTPQAERSDDMFCDDIFGESPAGVRKTAKGDGLRIERSGLHDNWDDPEGYYGYRLGEILDGRYEIVAAHGKGVFSTVVRAKDLKAGNGDPEEVAIKIIRNNETMYKAGMEELVILNKLVGADPDNKRHCVRFLSSFKYRNHLCLVFESLHMNLREVLKKFGRNIGLRLTAVRAYAKQLFIALKHLKNCGVLHCDIKPDNMLVNEAKNVLKLCDFGNAMFAGKNEVTPYLVSRFYRAPEIILGLQYDHPLDMWSVGCCLFELYTGKVLFPGPSNNDMLRLQMELKGPFPKKMLRKGAFTEQHFDHDLNFHASEEDLVTKKIIKRVIVNVKTIDFGKFFKGLPGDDPKMLANFKDLLEKTFILDPDKRLTVSQALSHPFITGK